MTPFTLGLKRLPSPVRPPAAWLLSGSDPAAWIEEILRWPVEDGMVEILLLPASRADRSVAGALVILPPESALPVAPRGSAYGRIGERLFLPADAAITPLLAEERLQEMLPELFLVFHPAAGLIGFEPEEVLALEDLLEPPEILPPPSRTADPGVATNRRLRSVRLIAKREVQALLIEEQWEIAAAPVEKLPPAPQERRVMVGRTAWQRLRLALAKRLERLALRQPLAAAGRPTWLDRLAAWASAMKRRAEEDLDHLRYRAIYRLLHMLRNQPERGLRHAIPLRKRNFRGLDKPGTRLPDEDPNFNLRRFQEEGPADLWNIAPSVLRALREEYLRLAQRELALGRCGRAAFIYAELLGDLHGAAMVLKQGKRFCEAALIYRDHLHRPLEAAACFEAAGLLQEAIPLYEGMQMFEQAGNLLDDLGETENARCSFRRAVKKHLDAENPLAAAALLEKKLDSPEDAIRILSEAWPESPEAGRCVEEHLNLLGRLGRSEEAAALLDRLREESTPSERLQELAQALAETSRHHPDAAIRFIAADLARVKIGCRLEDAGVDETRRLLDLLPRLAPGDLLLYRDSRRYLERMETYVPDRVEFTPGKWVAALRSFQMPGQVTWSMATVLKRAFFAAGYTADGDLQLLRGDWGGATQSLLWRMVDFGPAEGRPSADARPLPNLILKVLTTIQITAGSVPGLTVLLQRRFSRALKERSFPPDGTFREEASRAGTPGWLPDDVLAVCMDSKSVWALRGAKDGFLLACFSLQGSLKGATPVLTPIESEHWFRLALEGAPFHMAVADREIAYACDRHLYISDLKRKVRTEVKYDGAITGLSVFRAHSRYWLTVSLEEGVELRGLDENRHKMEWLARDLNRPLAAYPGCDCLLIAGDNIGRIYDLARMRAVLSFPLPARVPLAAGSIGPRRIFAIIYPSGEVGIYKLPGYVKPR